MNEEAEGAGREQLVYGVPARTVVDALRGAGIPEDDVVAVLGRAIARSSGRVAAEVTPPFVFQTQVPERAPQCEVNFDPTFTHPDFIDGVTVVQAGETPTELGFNHRFHAIEDDLAAVAEALRTVSNCMKELRLELFGVVQELQVKITQIDARLDGIKDKEGKEGKEKQEGKETKEDKESKEKEGKDDKESKEHPKEHKDGKESEKHPKDGDKEFTELTGLTPPGATLPGPDEAEGDERTFISLDDRPEVGGRALADPDEDA